METSPDEMLDRGTALPLPTSYEEDTSANENSDDYMINLLADVCTENVYEAEPKSKIFLPNFELIVSLTKKI